MNDIPGLQHPVASAADQSSSPSPPDTTSAAARRLSRVKERIIETLLLLAAFSSVAITVGIVGTLAYESSSFFAHVPLKDFLTDTLWTPLFASPRFGILPGHGHACYDSCRSLSPCLLAPLLPFI